MTRRRGLHDLNSRFNCLNPRHNVGTPFFFIFGLTGDQGSVVVVSCAASYFIAHGLGQGLLPKVTEKKVLKVLALLDEHDEATRRWTARVPAAGPSGVTGGHES